MKRILFPAIIFFLACMATAFAQDIFVSPIMVQTAGAAATKEDGLKYATEFVKDTASHAGALAFKPLSTLSPMSLNILTKNFIYTKLEASVVCFYEKIDYLLYGTITVDPAKQTYVSSFYFYNRTRNSVLRQFDSSGQAPSMESYLAEIAPPIALELQKVIATLPAARAEPTPAPTPAPTPVPTADKTTTPATDKTEPGADKTTTPADKTEPQADKTTPADTIVVQLPPKPVERNFGMYISAGYFLLYMHEWMDAIIPCLVLEEGIKATTLLADTDEFDFGIRWNALFHYSFAINQADNPYYTHFHTVKLKFSLEFYFEVADSFAMYFGAGPFYRVDVIDYQNLALNFFTDIPMAAGTYGFAGLEFTLNKEGTLSMGVTTSFDLTFYSEWYLENNFLLYFIFKI